MTTAISKQDTAIKIHGDEFFSAEQWKLLTDAIMRDATPDEVQFFAQVCKRSNLDPFKRQIHAVKRWDNQAKRQVWSYQTGIDGYRAIAQRSGTYAGSDEPRFLPDDESTPQPRKATVTVWKIVGGQRVPFTASARWEEYVQTTKDGHPNSMWRKMPYGQLAKCAEALALRKAFPEELSGIYTDVEMEQADSESEKGKNVKSGQFDLESRPFEETTKPAEKPPETPPATKPKAEPKEPVIDAEVVTDQPAPLAVPAPIAKWTHGKWKEAMGNIRGKALGEAREAAFETGTADEAAQACASIYDEVQARLATKNATESALAEIACDAGLVEFPADLWSKASNYPAILSHTKQIA